MLFKITNHDLNKKSCTSSHTSSIAFEKLTVRSYTSNLKMRDFAYAAKITRHHKSRTKKMRLRKEIRSLSIAEWDRVVRAMWIMKLFTNEEGKATYGKLFANYDSLVAKHVKAALNPEGDQAHFGPIFPIYHRAWLLAFENSLLAIDPSIEG